MSVTVQSVQEAVNGVLACYMPTGRTATADSPLVQTLCTRLEQMLLDGHDRSRKHSAEATFWPLLGELLSPTERSTLSAISTLTTDIGRARAWLRMTLNEKTLARWISRISAEHVLGRKFYSPGAFILDEDRMGVVNMLAIGLESVTFALDIEDISLNQSLGADTLTRTAIASQTPSRTNESRIPVAQVVAVELKIGESPDALQDLDKKKSKKTRKPKKVDVLEPLEDEPVSSEMPDSHVSSQPSLDLAVSESLPPPTVAELSPQRVSVAEPSLQSPPKPSTGALSESHSDEIQLLKSRIEILEIELHSSRQSKVEMHLRNRTLEEQLTSSLGTASDLSALVAQAHEHRDRLLEANSSLSARQVALEESQAAEAERAARAAVSLQDSQRELSEIALERDQLKHKIGILEASVIENLGRIGILEHRLTDETTKSQTAIQKMESQLLKAVQEATFTKAKLRRALQELTQVRKDSRRTPSDFLEFRGLSANSPTPFQSSSLTTRIVGPSGLIPFDNLDTLSEMSFDAGIVTRGGDDRIVSRPIPMRAMDVQVPPTHTNPAPVTLLTSDIEAQFQKQIETLLLAQNEMMDLNDRLTRELMERNAQVVQLGGSIPEQAVIVAVTTRQDLDCTSPQDFGDNVSNASGLSALSESDVDLIESTHRLQVWIPRWFEREDGDKTFVVFEIQLRLDVDEWRISRRYSNFVEFHQQILASFGKLAPDLPAKRLFSFGKREADDLEKRRADLEVYLRRTLALFVNQPHSQLARLLNKALLCRALPFLAEPTERRSSEDPAAATGHGLRENF
eukprot:m.754732 g.754732  ORF g.754732 m.754732 type:complete len:799 (+) comp59003_c0_seq11:178-2574(+)